MSGSNESKSSGSLIGRAVLKFKAGTSKSSVGDTSRTLPSEGKASNTEEVFGLFPLFDPQCPLENDNSISLVLPAVPDPVDIIAIHGLGGSAFKTWTHENGKLWLQDFCCLQFPGARIYTFGYDSGFAFSKGTSTLHDFAKSFLEAVRLTRSTLELSSRRLILVCHSMGGIVAKLAIAIAKNEPHRYPGIGQAITGVVFLGTPHQGSPSARYATILARTANVIIIGTQLSRFTGPMRADLLKSLTRHEDGLLRIAKDFRHHAMNMQIRSFVEGKKMRGLNERVVDDHSAFVGVPSEREIPMPGFDHREICRHGSMADSGLRLILGAITDCVSPFIPPNPSHVLQVPYMADCSRVLQIPFQLNPSFVGQRDILQRLNSALGSDGENRCRQVALFGLGGIGKSQIALQYAHTVKGSSLKTSIFWVFAGSNERFTHDYSKIAQALKLPGYDDPEIDVRILVKTALESSESGDWLLIIDNADNMPVFFEPETGSFQYVPENSSGSILYTTRNKVDAMRLTGGGTILHAEELNLDDSKILLHRKLGDQLATEDSCQKLIEALQFLPLAIVQAASYIRENSWTLEKFLRHFEDRDADSSILMLLHDFRDKTREETVANAIFKTWVITIRQLEEQYPQAAEVLWQMTFYHCQNIPRSLLLGPSERITFLDPKDTKEEIWAREVIESTSISDFSLDEAIGRLVAYSFVTVGGAQQQENYTLHRLVQKFAQYWITDHRRIADKMARKALDSLLHEFPTHEYADWPKSAELLPHAQKLLLYTPLFESAPHGTGLLLISVSKFLRAKSQDAAAAKYNRKAIALLNRALGDTHPAAISAIHSLGKILCNQKQLPEAEDLLKSAVDGYTKAYTKDHESVFQAMTSLSGVLHQQGRYEEAEELAKEASIALERLEGLDRVATIDAKRALAVVLGDKGEEVECLRILEYISQVSVKLGPRHPRTLFILHDLSVIYTRLALRSGNAIQAVEMNRRVVGLNQELYGPHHPRTTNSLYNLALALQSQGNSKEAEPLFRKALNTQEKFPGFSSSEKIASIRELISCLDQQNLYKEAIELSRKAVRMSEGDPETCGHIFHSCQRDLNGTLSFRTSTGTVVGSNETPTSPKTWAGGGYSYHHVPFPNDPYFGR